MAVINTNISSLNAQRNLAASAGAQATSMQRLSSGLRVNSAKDDAAGLAIATRMDSQIRGSTVALRNANDAISFAQTGEGALSKMTDAMQRMRDLAVQSANDTNTAGDRDNLQTEFKQLQDEVTRLQGTKFNGSKILGGATAGADHTFQVGAGTDPEDTIKVTTGKLDKLDAATKAASVISGSDGTAATTAIGAIDDALTQINSERANFGAVQNRFESVIGNLQISVENQSAAKSRIMDTDFAAETANMTRGNILQQAGTAMLAQANSAPNSVLSLLR
jgi:flagellin